MKKLVLILFVLPVLASAQKAYIPDDVFEEIIELRGWGDGIQNNDSVSLNKIENVKYLFLDGVEIYDLTGINAFVNIEELAVINLKTSSVNINKLDNLQRIIFNDNVALDTITFGTHPELYLLHCNNNALKYLDLRSFSNIEQIQCVNNDIFRMEVAGLNKLKALSCYLNPILSIDLSDCTSLRSLSLNNTRLKELDLSDNLELRYLKIENDSIESLDLSKHNLYSFYARNGYLKYLKINLSSIVYSSPEWDDNRAFFVRNNPYLDCIEVEDSAYAIYWFKRTYYENTNSHHYFSEDCNYNNVIDTNITDTIHKPAITKTLVRVVDVIGKESTQRKNTLLFYIFSDGTVEKRIIIE